MITDLLHANMQVHWYSMGANRKDDGKSSLTSHNENFNNVAKKLKIFYKMASTKKKNEAKEKRNLTCGGH